MSEVTGRSDERVDASGALADTTGENLLVTGDPLVGKRSFVLDVATEAAVAGRDVLVVTAAKGAGALPRRLREARGLSVVDCSPGTGESFGSVTTVGTPADRTGVSMPVSRFLADAEQPVVVVDSLSTFLLYADDAPVFRFLSVLTAHVRRSGGLGLYTMDRGCHEEQTFRTFAQLFDGDVGLRPVETAPEATPAAADGGDAVRPAEVRVRGLADFDGEWTPR